MPNPNQPIWFNSDPKVETIDLSAPQDKSPHRIMVCTPVHSDVSMHYCQAVLKFQQDCLMRKILVSFTLMKSSLVTQGRNLCVAEMLNHADGYTHLLFIDSDIDFNFSTIEKMLKADKDVIACPYPMKTFDFDKVWRRMHTKQSINSADDLRKGGFTFPLKLEDQNKIISDNGVVEVTHAPTGCMLIKREVIEKMIEKYPDKEIVQKTVINGKYVNKPNMWNFFDTLHDPKEKTYNGEDFAFCKLWRDIGGKCYAYVNDAIVHIGEHQYQGKFYDELIATK